MFSLHHIRKAEEAKKRETFLQVGIMEGQSNLNPFGIELEDLEFSPLAFSLALVHYFLTVILFFHFLNESVYSVPLNIANRLFLFFKVKKKNVFEF